MEYIFQRIIQNDFQWIRPSPGRLGPSGEGEYVKENGFGHEDWNFNTKLTINNYVYGYCYYKPREQIQNEIFNIAFGIYKNQQWYLIGFYLESKFVKDPPVQIDIIKKKMIHLKKLGDSIGPSWSELPDEAFFKELKRQSRYLKWEVSKDNVYRIKKPIPIPKNIFNTGNYRLVTPTSLDEKVFKSLYNLAQSDMSDQDYDEESEFIESEEEGGFPEGKEAEQKHIRRERNPAVIKAAKDAFFREHNKLFCQVCGFDFFEKYGKVGKGFIEGHHTIPISELQGEVRTKPRDIALVCSNCHRMLHRKRPWLKMNELKNLLKKPKPLLKKRKKAE